MRRHSSEMTGEAEITSGTDFVLHHPFTLITSGPSACGKSTLIKSILQKNNTTINPPPQRIVWLYKRWQPLYDIIKATVNPPVEFMQGLPDGIEQSTFFDSKMNNLLIVDDLMESCGKDPRMTEIFYEGSHHRSLSVVLLCQNLYYSKSPTQRRNSHYVVLFKNPNDLQSIMTFARQINPRKTKEFMQIYEEATMKPHGYLLLDFKQATPENKRLRPNIFDDVINTEDHKAHQMEITYSSDENETSHLRDSFQRDHINMISCDDCGILFENIHDLQRHLKTWCAMKLHSQEVARQHKVASIPPTSSMEPPLKKRKISEHQCFKPVRIDIGKRWAKTIEEGQQTYMEQGHLKEKARAMTINDNIKEIRKELRETYANYIKHWMYLNENSLIHQKVMAKVEELHDSENLDWIDAARLAIKQYKPLIDPNILPQQKEESSDEEENEEEIREED